MNKVNFGPIFLLLTLVTQTSQSYSEDYYNGAGAENSISSEEDTDKPKTWVLLVAGSNGWSNYRHQADICHAYQVIKNHGIPAEHIITMMYDDIVNNEENPFPGKIYNSPARKDVYKGVKIDYREEDVNPKNFLAVLSGNKSAVEGGNGKVIQSTNTDKIFVFFSDHGAPGLIAFPDDVLTVKQLSQTLHNMHKNQKYSELTFYLEACESGSMFDGKILPAEMKIYAVTAANGHESSWGCYCEEGDLPCLGDLFSVNWIVDSEKEDHTSETLKHQFDIVKQMTNKSHVCTFGDLQIMKEHVSEFQGQEKSDEPVGPVESPHDYTMWPSRDIPLLYLMSKRDNEESKTLKSLLTHQIHVMQKVVCTKYFQLKQHSDTSKHQANVDRFQKNNRKQSFLTSSLVDVERDQFSEDLCKAFIGANIPFKKLNKSALKDFLFKYCKREIPDESTLRKKYLKICYQQSVNQIQEKIGESFIWASVDETTDIMGRYVANLMVGKLDSEGFHKPHLVSVKMLEATNNSTIARFVNDGLRNFLLTGEKENRLLLLVTDAARYMLKAGRGLSIFYPNMLHVTCICHGLHRVSELIRNLFPEVDSLIANTKKVFTKAPSRVVVYKDICRDLSLPPMPILTRWGTWIEAAVFYSKNFTLVKSKRRYLESQIVELVKKIVHDENNQKRVLSVYPTQLDKHLDCHHTVVNAFHRACFNFSKNPYAMKYVYVLANLCEMGIEAERLVTNFMDHCADKAEDILNIE